jgi:hypothetical protein
MQAICASTSHRFTKLKRAVAGKPLLGGFFLTGLAGSCGTADEQAAKYEDKSERLQQILPIQEAPVEPDGLS